MVCSVRCLFLWRLALQCIRSEIGTHTRALLRAGHWLNDVVDAATSGWVVTDDSPSSGSDVRALASVLLVNGVGCKTSLHFRRRFRAVTTQGLVAKRGRTGASFGVGGGAEPTLIGPQNATRG
jgi:hypothetical protein